MTAQLIASICWDKDLCLESERLILQPLEESDVGKHYVNWLNDTNINAFLETRWSEQNAETIKSFVIQQNADASSLLLGIKLRETGEHIGNIKLGPINLFHLCGDVSYFIGDRSSWGKGYATEAIQTIVDCGFRRMGLHRIQAGCYEANIGSAKALTKVGFKHEGTWRSHVVDPDGNWQDHLWFGLLAEEWGDE